MSLISGQATTFDYLHQPWVYDPDLGPIVAPRAPESGEGLYRYKLQGNEWFVEKNPSPTSEDVFKARFDANIQRTVQMAFANDDEFVDSEEEQESSSSPPPTPMSSSCPTIRHVVKRPPLPSRPSSHVPRLDKNAHNDALLKAQGCVVAPKLRESNGRMDMRIYDPQSGKHFRSRLEAMRFFNISQ